MKFELSEEQESLRASVRAVVGTVSPSDGNPIRDDAAWNSLARDMQLASIELDGGGAIEHAIVMSEIGRATAAIPYFSSVVLAGGILRRCGSAMADPSQQLSKGEIQGSMLLPSGGSLLDTEHTAYELTRAGSSYRLTGMSSYAIDAGEADILLVAVADAGDLALCVARTDTAGVVVSKVHPLDPTRPAAAVAMEDAEARIVARGDEARAVLARVLPVAQVALASEMVGAARRSLEMAVEHIRSRDQFGRPVGSFQSVKHLAADAYLHVEASEALVMTAAWEIDQCTPGADNRAAMAFVAAARRSWEVVSRTQQLFGALGFTWEFPAHLYLKRIVSASRLLGNVDAHSARVANLLRLRI